MFQAFKKILLVATVLGAACGAHAEQTSLAPLDSFPRGQLKIATSDARLHSFDIWIAADNAQREQGLMFVKSMPATSGMLFIYGQPQPISMWMKNTYIPLDMVFIRSDGRVASVTANTKPHSLKIIQSKEFVLAVLELNAGVAAKLNITPGAIVMHPVFGNDKR